ncbi:MAG: AAA family ATPase [Methanobrevibacter sp.]|nr:AAA family ATPase [Methanobrevibacter sp.]
MKISNIEIKNFKSFKNMSVSLNDFNVVVGQSASGKSNFVEAFDFLKDIAEDFEKGVYDNGSMLIQNLNCNRDTPSCIKATLVMGILLLVCQTLSQRKVKKSVQWFGILLLNMIYALNSVKLKLIILLKS